MLAREEIRAQEVVALLLEEKGECRRPILLLGEKEETLAVFMACISYMRVTASWEEHMQRKGLLAAARRRFYRPVCMYPAKATVRSVAAAGKAVVFVLNGHKIKDVGQIFQLGAKIVITSTSSAWTEVCWQEEMLVLDADVFEI